MDGLSINESVAMASQAIPPQESIAPPTRASDVTQATKDSTREGVEDDGTDSSDNAVADNQLQDGQNKSQASTTETLNPRSTLAEARSENDEEAALVPEASEHRNLENNKQAVVMAENVADQPMGDVSMAIANPSPAKDVSPTAQKDAFSTLPTDAAPSTSVGTEATKSDTAPLTPGHGLNKVVERKEPAVLGDFVSLAEMEGRQHLRFNSKSPEVSWCLSYDIGIRC